MRKRFLLIFATFGLIISMGIFAACTSRGDTKYSISFYDETDLIGVVETAGMESIVLPEAPEKEEYLFRGKNRSRKMSVSMPFMSGMKNLSRLRKHTPCSLRRTAERRSGT